MTEMIPLELLTRSVFLSLGTQICNGPAAEAERPRVLAETARLLVATGKMVGPADSPRVQNTANALLDAVPAERWWRLLVRMTGAVARAAAVGGARVVVLEPPLCPGPAGRAGNAARPQPLRHGEHLHRPPHQSGRAGAQGLPARHGLHRAQRQGDHHR